MLDIVILAAGMGTRMKSEMPKVLHPVAGRPMILEVLATAQEMKPQQCVIVVGHGAEQVQALVGKQARFALQAEQLGTGHAVMQAREALQGSRAETTVVLYGDSPLVRAETLHRAIAHQRESGAAVTLLSFLPDDPTGYGRIVRDDAGAVVAIVEQKDATKAQRAIRESNSGIMLFESEWLWKNLDKLTLSPQGEYYLTDLSALAVSQGREVEAMIVNEQEVMGVNNRVQLAKASQQLWERRRERLLLAGVTLVDPSAVWLDAGVTVERDTIIHPGVQLRGSCKIGGGCEIGPHTLIEDSVLGEGCVVTQAHVSASTIASGSHIGPFEVVRGRG